MNVREKEDHYRVQWLRAWRYLQNLEEAGAAVDRIEQAWFLESRAWRRYEKATRLRENADGNTRDSEAVS